MTSTANGVTTCTAFDSSKVVSKCYQYDTNSNCIQCEKEYLLDAGKCDNKAPTDMKDQLTNCAIKAADGSCSQCQDGSWALGYSSSMKSQLCYYVKFGSILASSMLVIMGLSAF